MTDTVATDHTRRNLVLALGAGSVGAAALAGPTLNLAASATGGGVPDWWARLFVSLAEGSVDEWAAIRGQVFSIDGEKGTQLILLSDVKLLPSKGVRPAQVSRQRAFALVFNAAPGSPLAGERAYRLRHPSYPPLDVYMDPARTTPRSIRLTAIFN
jgi:hypothetical protein